MSLLSGLWILVIIGWRASISHGRHVAFSSAKWLPMKRGSSMTNAHSVSHGEMSADRASVAFVVNAQLYSMKNSKTLTTRGGRVRSIKHPKATAFEREFMRWHDYSGRPDLRICGPVRAIVSVWYPSCRQDLDCALVYDLLQKGGIIENDRQVVEKHEFWHVDRKNPRVEVSIEEI